eukprot:TRINITY_DN1932_c0_g1_i1.p2 TRINITY_DN1932_c0_g1~~TRINITY_DN1932_c0_g1_i1.p2  ORF type:complete len:227 (+),score=38.48 TRINITY_DN1932_c0_g1_i1:337-1017(+)
MGSLNNIRYTVVARLSDKVVVASYFYGPDSGRLGQFEATVNKVLSSARLDERPRLTIMDKELGTIHYDSDFGCVFLVVTSSDYPQRTAFKFLEDFKEQFRGQFGDQIDDAMENGLNKPAKRFFPEICGKYDNPANVDKISGVLAQVEDVKGVMHDNINQILATHDDLEVLQDKTENMRHEAHVFQKQSTQLKRNEWWKNMKLKIIITLVVLFVLVIVGLIIYAAVK